MKNFIKIISSIAIIFLFYSCNSIPQYTFNAASIWADSEILKSSYNKIVPIYEINKENLTIEEIQRIEDFLFIADYLINEFTEMSINKTTFISLQEITMLWSEAKKSYITARPIVIERMDKLSSMEKMTLQSFDFKAQNIDKEFTRLLTGENTDATEVLIQIASILGITLKIITAAAVL